MAWDDEQRRRERGINRKADRAEAQLGKIQDRFGQQVARDEERLTRRLSDVDLALTQDPIAALDVRFDEASGWHTTPIVLDGEVIKGQFSVTSTGNDDVELPAAHDDGASRVAILGLLVFRWATLVAFKIENRDDEYRIKLNWVKPRNRTESSAFIVADDQYCYPLSTSIGGEVVPGTARIGVVAFEPLRVAPKKTELHLSDVKLTKKRGERQNLTFAFSEEVIRNKVEGALATPSLVETAAKAIAAARDKVVAEVNASVAVNRASVEDFRSEALEQSRSAATTGAVLAVVIFVAIAIFVLLMHKH